ncbi:NAD(P)-binding protein [Meredithblackwellia eburnea MCA 4105]
MGLILRISAFALLISCLLSYILSPHFQSSTSTILNQNMSTYTSFAVAGAGNVGKFFIESLAAVPSVQVTVLSRDGATLTLPAGVVVKKVNYEDPVSLESALKGVQVVVSALGGPALAAGVQRPLADAAKKAGVSLFVPSEYGVETIGVKEGPLVGKEAAAQYLKSIGLPSVRLITGPFTDFIFNPRLGFAFAEGTATWFGKGEQPVTWTARPDIATFLAHVLTTLPPAELNDRVFRIEGDRKSLNEVVAIYEETHPGKKVVVTRKSVEEGKEALAKGGPAAFGAYLQLLWEAGEGSPFLKGLDNSVFPGWKPKGVKDILAAAP